MLRTKWTAFRGIRLALAVGFAFAAAGCSRAPELETMRKFQAAEEAFREARGPEDFLRAAALHQEVLDAGMESGAVFYNQGNAFMQAGKRGHAIAAYRLARRYRPRDPFLEANLKSALGDVAAEDRRPLLETLFFWQEWLSWPEKYHAAFAVALIAFGLGLAALVRPGLRVARTAAWGAAAVTLLLLASAAYDGVRYSEPRGVVAVPEVVARKGNATTYEPAFNEPLREGADFAVVEERAGWLLVRLAGGLEGWIEREAAVRY